MATQDFTQLSRGAALLLLLGGPGVLALRSGGWFGYVLFAAYILVMLALFDRARDRWRRLGKAAIWFDLSAVGVGLIFCALFLI